MPKITSIEEFPGTNNKSIPQQLPVFEAEDKAFTTKLTAFNENYRMIRLIEGLLKNTPTTNISVISKINLKNQRWSNTRIPMNFDLLFGVIMI